MDEQHQDFSNACTSDPVNWNYTDTIHSDLLATRDLVYNPCRFDCSQPLGESQNADYGAYVFNLNALSIRFRVAKITPSKIGQFVTLWERIGNGPTQPYDISESVDFFVISTRHDNNLGQFIFPTSVLCDQDIVSSQGKGGKRGIRVYPSWDQPTSRQALKTQAWQLKYFLEIPLDKPIDHMRAQKLYGL